MSRTTPRTFSVIDEAGNIVSNTYTMNSFYGSQVMPRGTGVLLNDIMAGFSNRAGGRNEIKPGKRPVSSMSPTIVLHADGSPWFALGSPGSATIPNTVFQVIVNIIDSKMSLRDAVEFPRIHHQYQPDRVDAEPAALIYDVAERLQSFGPHAESEAAVARRRARGHGRGGHRLAAGLVGRPSRRTRVGVLKRRPAKAHTGTGQLDAFSCAYPRSAHGIKPGSSSDHQTMTRPARDSSVASRSTASATCASPAGVTVRFASGARRASASPNTPAPRALRSSPAPGSSPGCLPSRPSHASPVVSRITPALARS